MIGGARGAGVRRFGACALASLFGALAAPNGASAASTAARPVVVELFTSQGCSSCPPADAFLGELARARPDVLALDFHVTYWNGGGWRDPWSLDAATARQRAYASLFGDQDVYTPEMVVDGRTGLVGSDRPAALSAIAKAATDPSPTVPIRLARMPDGATTIAIGPRPAGTTDVARVLVIGFDPAHDTTVRAGENDGRALHEVDVVRAIADAGRWIGSAQAFRVSYLAGSETAVLLQADDGRILGAAVLS